MENQNQNQNEPVKEQEKKKNSLEKYCDENPDAVECRIYED
jgi:CP12 domain